MTPEEEELKKYRKQQRQEAEEQMAQMDENDANQERLSEYGLKDAKNINFQAPGANNYGLKIDPNANFMERTDNYGIAAPEDPNAGNRDIESLKKKLRAEYANDNEGYKQALAREGIDSEVHETNGVQSIQQAYYSGKIDKNTRDYMMADAIAKFARNTGRDIGNIGAQFTGGAINNNYETSEWDKRNSALAANETTARMAEQKGSEADIKRQSDKLDIAAKELDNSLKDMKLEVPRLWKNLIDNADNIENPLLKSAVKGAAQTMLDHAVNGGEVTTPEMIGAIVANGGNELAEAAEKAGKSVEQYVADAVKEFIKSPSFNIDAGINIGSLFGGKKDEEDPEKKGKRNPNKGDDAAHSNSLSQFSDANKNTLYDEISAERRNSGLARQIMSQTDANTDDRFITLPPEKQQAWLDIFENPIANEWFNDDNINIENAMEYMEKIGPDAVKGFIKEQVSKSLKRQNESLQRAIDEWKGYTSVGARQQQEALAKKQDQLEEKMKRVNEW